MFKVIRKGHHSHDLQTKKQIRADDRVEHAKKILLECNGSAKTYVDNLAAKTESVYQKPQSTLLHLKKPPNKKQKSEDLQPYDTFPCPNHELIRTDSSITHETESTSTAFASETGSKCVNTESTHDQFTIVKLDDIDYQETITVNLPIKDNKPKTTILKSKNYASTCNRVEINRKALEDLVNNKCLSDSVVKLT